MASMKELQDLLFEDDITSDEIIQWLQGTQKLSGFHDNQDLRRDFGPLFMNFLHKHTQRYFDKTGVQATAQTPKTPKYFSPIKNESKIISKKATAKSLDFSNVSTKNEHSSLDESIDSKLEDSSTSDISGSNHNGNLSPVQERSFFFIETSTPKSMNTSNRVQPISENSTPFSSTPKQTRGHRNKSRRYSQELSLCDMFCSTKKQGSSNKSAKQKRRSMPIPVFPVGRPNLSNEEEFPPVGAAVVPKKTLAPKRIKPTLVTASQFLAKQEFNPDTPTPFVNPAFSSSPGFESPSLSDERILLKIKKEKLQKEGLDVFTSPRDSFKSKSTTEIIPAETLEEPSLNHVTHKKKLTHLSNVYSKLIINDMVPNIIAEMYYLFQLITLEKMRVKSLSPMDVFDSYHNCIFFGITTLAKMQDYLELLDPMTLKLLSENGRIQIFDPVFHKKVYQTFQNHSSVNFESSLPANSSIMSVSFQTETDNSCNFPTIPAFQIFRKQRDLFYEILRCWQEKHSSPGWSFTLFLGKKLEELMSFQYYPANMMHLAKLFTQQLIRTCKTNEDADENGQELSFLSKLRHTDPSKLKSLKERLVTSRETTNPVPKPTFPGPEEFFRVFLVESRDHYFYCHVKNTLVARIREIVEEYMGCMEFKKTESWSHLHSLRLYGKFLGLVEFLPYQISDHLSENVLATFVAERNARTPTFMFSCLLKSSVEAGCLVMSIPWIVEFLSMADPVAFHTKSYLTLAFELIYIFKRLRFPIPERSCQCQLDAVSSSKKKLVWNSMNAFYIKIQLGWLFSLPHFPEGLFYASAEEAHIHQNQYKELVDTFEVFYSLDVCKCSHTVEETHIKETRAGLELGQFETPSKSSILLQESHRELSPVKFHGFDSPLKETPVKFDINDFVTPNPTPVKTVVNQQTTYSRQYLDAEPLIDHELLLLSCPYVKELTKILRSVVQDASKQNNSFRKITPLSSSKKCPEVCMKNTQALLIENFFHNQPVAVKKCVDFIVERLVNNLVTEIRSTLMPKYKKIHLEETRHSIHAVLKSANQLTDTKLDEMCHKACHSFITDVSKEAQDITEKTADLEHLKSSIGCLLPQNMTRGGSEMSYKIIAETVRTRISTWLQIHLPPGYCAKDFLAIMQKYSKEKQKDLKIARNESDNNHSSSNLSVKMNNVSESQVDTSGLKSEDESQCKQVKIMPSKLLQKIRKHLTVLNDNPMQPTVNEYIDDTLQDIATVTTTQYAVTPPLLRALESLTADLISTFVVTRPTRFTKEQITKLYKFWNHENGVFSRSSELLVLLSARSFLLLAFKPQETHDTSWTNILEVLRYLVFESKILSLSDVKDSFMALLKESWPEYFLKGIGELLKRLADCAGPNIDPFDRDIVSWMGWICTSFDDPT